MRRWPFLFFLAIISVAAISQNNPQPKKLGLIVAIGKYPQNSGWTAIASINDIKFIKGALINKGFKEKDIDTLKDQKATKAAILASLDNLAKKAGPNDIVVIHFSCHGQQIQDQDTEAEGKDELDGYDEALIPVDAKGFYNPNEPQYGGYDGEKHLRDDDLAKKFTAIRNKIKPNGNLLVLIDACHSGTASRATTNFISRGTPVPFQRPGYKVSTDITQSIKAGDENFFTGDGTDTLSNMVVISASSAYQQNFQLWDDDGKDVGSLSFAFAKAMADIQPGDDYELLFEKIKARIQAGIPTQIPVIEGNIQQEVLGRQFKKPQDNILLTVSKVDKRVKEDSVFIINKGALDNITKGSTCKIYAAGKKEVITEGVIVTVGTFQSAGVAKKLLNKTEAYRAEMDNVSFGEFSTSLSISDSIASNSLLKKQVTNMFKPYQFISISPTANAEMILKMKEQNGNIHVELFDRGDSTRWAKDIAATDTLNGKETDDLVKSIKNSIRIKYLRSLPDGGELNKDIVVELSTDNSKPGEELVLKPGDKYKVKFFNRGKEKLFFSVVDIMPDNSMKVLIPFEDRKPDEFVLEPQKYKEYFPTVDDITPSGKEIFKVFVTREAIDLPKIFDRKNKSASRSLKMSVEDMIDDTFKDSNNGAATRSDVSTVKLNEAGIVTVGFTIKK